MTWLIGALILWTSFWDARRDTGIKRVVSRGKWHCVKWTAWFPEQIFLTYLLWRSTEWYYAPILAVLSWIVWQVGHRTSSWEPKNV